MNLEIREIKHEEIFETSQLYVDTIKIEYEGLIPNEVLNELEVNKEAEDLKKQLSTIEKYHFVYVAVDYNKIVGFISLSSSTVEPFEFDAEINELFVKREFQSLGIGLRLLHFAVLELKENGYRQVMIYNFHKSKANGFYRKLDGRIIKKIKQDCYGKTLEVDVFGWEIDTLIKQLEYKLLRYTSI